MKNQESKPRSCPLCGGTQFIDGQMNAAHGVGFIPGPDAIWKRLFGPAEQVTAAKCQSCGHLLLFGDRPSKSPQAS